jgi:uncharacterized protein (DUF58 family)
MSSDLVRVGRRRTAAARVTGPVRMRAAATTLPTLVGAGALLGVASVERLIWPQLLGCALLGMVAWSFLAVFRVPHFVPSVDLAERLVVGEPFDLVVRVRNEDRWSRRDLVVRHRLRAGRRLVPDSTAYVERIRPRAEASVRLTAVPLARGVADGSELEVVLAGPFGFFTRSISHRVGHRTVVLPARATGLDLLLDGDLRPHESTGMAGADAEMRGIREWRPGDQLRDVHWRSTARSNHPAVLERNAPPTGGSDYLAVVVMAAPTRRGRLQSDPRFEQAISTAAATTAAALREGRRVCLLAQHATKNPPVAVGDAVHPHDERSVRDYLAAITATSQPSRESLQHVVRHAGRGGMLLLVANDATPSSWKTELLSAAAKASVRTVDVRKLVAEANEVGASR